MRIIGVIPAYNESGRIAATINCCRPFVDGLIVVDDGSTDGTESEAKLAGICVLRHKTNRGQGAALRTGTEAALRQGADIIVHLDADGQHDPAEIPSLIAPIVADSADVVLGSRFLGIKPTGMPLTRRLLLKAGRNFNAFALGIPKSVTDPQSGLRAFNAKAAGSVSFKQDKVAHASEILRIITRSNLRWLEVPSHVRYTPESIKKGQKNLDALRIAWQLFIGVFTK